MRLTILGPEPRPALAEALSAQGFALACHPVDPSPSHAGALAGLVRELDAALTADAADAVLVTATGRGALVAVVVAVKLALPTVFLSSESEAGGSPAAHVAHLELGANHDARAAARAVAALVAPTLPEP